MKDLYTTMPVMYLKALSVDKQDTRALYGCPIYKTRTRGPTYVWTFNIKTKNKPQKWILAGVALIMQVWKGNFGEDEDWLSIPLSFTIPVL